MASPEQEEFTGLVLINLTFGMTLQKGACNTSEVDIIEENEKPAVITNENHEK
jgi:hypothetical protein